MMLPPGPGRQEPTEVSGAPEEAGEPLKGPVEAEEAVEGAPSLELEEAEELPPLRLEAEEAEPREPVKVVEERPRIYRIGDHAVQEAVVEGQPVTWVRCVVCGAEAPLTELARLKGAPCRPSMKGGEVREVEEERAADRCEYCGGEAVGRYPAAGIEVALCGRCLGKYEEFYLKARPSLTVKRGSKAGAIRGRHPMELGEPPRPRVAWSSELMTWFIEGDDGWPCPACAEKFNRLADVIKHFAERHPERLGWERVYVRGVGDAPRTWQGIFCPSCGLFLESEEGLREHYRSHGGEGR